MYGTADPVLCRRIRFGFFILLHYRTWPERLNKPTNQAHGTATISSRPSSRVQRTISKQRIELVTVWFTYFLFLLKWMRSTRLTSMSCMYDQSITNFAIPHLTSPRTWEFQESGIFIWRCQDHGLNSIIFIAPGGSPSYHRPFRGCDSHEFSTCWVYR